MYSPELLRDLDAQTIGVTVPKLRNRTDFDRAIFFLRNQDSKNDAVETELLKRYLVNRINSPFATIFSKLSLIENTNNIQKKYSDLHLGLHPERKLKPASLKSDYPDNYEEFREITHGLCLAATAGDSYLEQVWGDYFGYLQRQEGKPRPEDSPLTKKYVHRISLGSDGNRGGYESVTYHTDFIIGEELKVLAREIVKNREARYRLYRSTIPVDELKENKAFRHSLYVIWDEEPGRVVKYKNKDIVREKRISAVSGWILYDSHEVYGKHANLEILCSRVEYLGPNVTKLEDIKDLSDDSLEIEVNGKRTKLDFTLENLKKESVSQVLFGMNIGAKKKQPNASSAKPEEQVQGLGRVCFWAMLMDAYQRGYHRIVLSVTHNTGFDPKDDNWAVTRKKLDVESEGGASVDYYKKQGFQIIQDKLEIGYVENKRKTDTKEGSRTQQYVMAKVLKEKDYRKIITDVLSFTGSDVVLKSLFKLKPGTKIHEP